MNDLPAGYRWATANECEIHGIEPNPEMIVVPRTADASGKPYTEGEADLALPLRPLGVDKFGDVTCSAEFGEFYVVRITYNRDPEGTWVEDDDYTNFTLHGDFDAIEQAQNWMELYPDGDRDIKDMDIVNVNRVRPVTF
jgi:hypothetical protein